MAASGTGSQRLSVPHGVGVALACAAVLALLAQLGVFGLLDLRLHDWRYKLRGPVPASPAIALVEIDDPTIAAYRSWPLPRETYALLIAALEEAGAASIGFDLLFLGDSPGDPTADRLLAGVTANEPNLVHAIAFLPEDASLGSGASAPERAREALVRHGRPLTRQPIASAMHAALPYDALLEASDALGHTAVAVDRDGVVRRIPQYVRFGDWAYPSLAIRVVETAARSDSTLPQFELAEDGIWMHRHGRPRQRVPTDAEGSTAIVFAGGRDAFANHTSMLKVLQWTRDRDTTALREAFAGKLVLVGATAVGEVATDIGATPFSEAAPLLFIHANAVNAAMRGNFLSRPPTGLLVLVFGALAALLGMLFSVLPMTRSIVLTLGTTLAIAVVDYALFAGRSVDLRPTALLLLPPLAWVAVEGYRRGVTERAARVRERELDVARTIQQHLLPAGPPDTPEFEVFGINLPADAVGGDYYDWVRIGEDGLAVCVGDVSGHGVPAALLMSHLRASFHAEAREGVSPHAIVQSMHASLSRAAQSGRFATFFLALFSRREPVVCFCNGGHNPPLLVRNGAIETLDATGLPLAMLDFAEYEDARREFRPGDLLILYSDGVTEAPHRNDLYGDDRFRAKVLEFAARGLSPAELGRALIEDVRSFARGELSADDVTLVVVRRV